MIVKLTLEPRPNTAPGKTHEETHQCLNVRRNVKTNLPGPGVVPKWLVLVGAPGGDLWIDEGIVRKVEVVPK